jgi:hypothetical protein
VRVERFAAGGQRMVRLSGGNHGGYCLERGLFEAVVTV